MKEEDREIREAMQRIIDEDTAVLALISFDGSRIKGDEIEEIMMEMKKIGIRRLIILVESFLGLRRHFLEFIKTNLEIVVFAPHISSNGGNMGVFIEDGIIMGEATELIFDVPRVQEMISKEMRDDIERGEIWRIMKRWIRRYVGCSGMIIRFVLPEGKCQDLHKL
jgi:hypothetical protein